MAAAAVASSFTMMLLVFQFFGVPKIDFPHLRPKASVDHPTLHQIPIDLPGANSDSLENGTRYLLGVGKADITGYGSERHGR